MTTNANTTAAAAAEPPKPIVEDYLEQDAAIRGQNYACMSFISPEKILRQRQVFVFGKFVDKISTDLAEMLDALSNKFEGDVATQEMIHLLREKHGYLWNNEEMQNQYLDFEGVNTDSLQAAYQAEHGLQTSIRGFKVRGVYDTYEEACLRSKKLNQKDPAFGVYVAQVGCWCPWDPSPEALPDGEYGNETLNTIVKNYKMNEEKKEAYHAERKRLMVDRLNDPQTKNMFSVEEVHDNDPSSVSGAEPVQQLEQHTVSAAPPPGLQSSLENDDAYANWLKSRTGK